MTETTQSTDTFPLGWTEWRTLWADWLAAKLGDGTLTRTGYKMPAKNFMADEVLGVWHCNGRNVELSEVTFMGERGIGITYGEASGTFVPSDLGADRVNIANTFAELETELAS